MPRTDLGLMGPIHIGFGHQNHKNKCPTQASLMHRLYSSQLVDSIEKEPEILREYSLKNKESMKKKRYLIPSPSEGDMTKTSLSAPNSNML